MFDSVQRLRKQSQAAGNLKTTPQQTVETQTTQGGQQVIVIEPANPQVVYVPQYDPQVVYAQPAATTVVVQEDDDDAAVAGAVIGFAAGIAIGAGHGHAGEGDRALRPRPDVAAGGGRARRAKGVARCP